MPTIRGSKPLTSRQLSAETMIVREAGQWDPPSDRTRTGQRGA